MAVKSRLIVVGFFLSSFVVLQSVEEVVKKEEKCRYFIHVGMH